MSKKKVTRKKANVGLGLDVIEMLRNNPQVLEEEDAILSLMSCDVMPAITLLKQGKSFSAEFQAALAGFLEEQQSNLKPTRPQGRPKGKSFETEERSFMVAGMMRLVKERDGKSDDESAFYVAGLGVSKKGHGSKAKPGEPVLSAKSIKRYYLENLGYLKRHGPHYLCEFKLRYLEGKPPPPYPK